MDAGGQITSKRILDDAFNSSNKISSFRPKQTIQDLEELYSYQQAKRKEFEQQLNKNRLNFGQWLRYAKWELEHNHDFARVRSIMERALDVNVEHIPFWTHYIQLELIHKNINHARNLLQRATTTLPNVDKLWFLYVQTEEMLKNYQMVRIVFEKWLKWPPNETTWEAYANFEARYEETENVRRIYQRYLAEYPRCQVWLKWVDYELQNNPSDIAQIRAVFEAAIDFVCKTPGAIVDDDEFFPKLVASWLAWELRCQELERVKAIHELLLDSNRFKYSSKVKKALLTAISEIENVVGDKKSIESSIIQKRRIKYEEDIEIDPTNYDSWWSYISIVVSQGESESESETERESREKLREIFDKSTLYPPTDAWKNDKWRKYIMIWVRYAFWEEFDNSDIEAARAVWNSCLKIMSQKSFISGKVWIGLAEFELRNNSENGLSKARKVLGRALGQMNQCGPKMNILKYYIKLEKRLCEWDRVRLIYQKWLELCFLFRIPCNDVVKQLLSFETFLDEEGRCEALMEVLVDLCVKEKDVIESRDDRAEIIEMAIEFFTEALKYDKVRDIYKSMVDTEPTAHNWINLALFESTIPTTDQLEQLLEDTTGQFEISVGREQIENTRSVYKKAVLYFRKHHDQENQKLVLESWREYEEANGDDESIAAISSKLPKRVKKRKTVNGIEEEYYELVFPPEDEEEEEEKEESNPPVVPPSINKFLANARKWAETKK
ncbi:CLF1 [Candida oxycetoniae]|uniref:Pre-mRNA-splicing factor CLF1 n=1 Tax=Candida oxycetoniae TaxID=497107 RepID=A0AAI9WYE6_9ASCO|nr:CLF1 [Candida oxycetoniae]KAI3405211.2 CLF1 [Candida oxycetoniae]